MGGLYKMIVLELALVLQIGSQLATCGHIVEFLPGFEGPLPFVLETGYVGVDEAEDVQIFYYFIQSENNPRDDPLLLWLTGGPGCSAFSGLVFEIGPLAFNNEEYNGSVPTLVLRPVSWTKASSIIFVDLPVETGFSYTKTKVAIQQSDWVLIHHAHQFLRKWLVDHPEFLSNEVYLGGDSYSGIPLPVIVEEISNGNEEGVEPWINLKGYLLGNALTTRTEGNYAIPYAHGHGFISDELYESLKKNCKGEYQNIDPKNVLCQRDIFSYYQLILGLSSNQILEPICEFASPKPYWRSLWTFLTSQLTVPPLTCRSYGYLLSSYWANNENVRKALHVRKGSKVQWQRCNFSLNFQSEIPSSFQYHVNLSKKGYRSLIYSGDLDMIVPFLGTQAWIRSLNYSIVDDWRQWYSNGQVAGYTRTYSNRMTFATVKGGGHTAPEYMPEECLAMFSRWISNKPL